MSAYLLIFLASAGTTFLVTPLVRRMVVRMGAIDRPGDRKVHPVATPTMGGLAMYAGFLVGLGVSFLLPFFSDMQAGSPEPLAALVTCTLMVGLGLIDDRRGTSALAKFTAQVFIAGVLYLMGASLTYFWIPGSLQVVSLTSDLSVLLTILWVVVIANAVNLVDGLDGLAAGMVAITAGCFFIYVVRTPSTFGDASAAALLSVITVGICVGFLPWNFHPAKIFMGDTGSMLLGMLVALFTISGVGRNPLPPSGGDLAAIAGPLLVLLLVLFIPFLDVVLAVARRTWRGSGDRPRRQGAHPPSLDGDRAQPPSRGAADVPVEPADLRQRPGRGAHRWPDHRRADPAGRPGPVPDHGAPGARPMAASRRRTTRRDPFGPGRDLCP